MSLGQAAFVAVGIVFAVGLRLAFGPFSLQGLLFVIITAIAASWFGPWPAAITSLCGFVAAHIPIVLASPGFDPSLFTSRRYAVGLVVYFGLSAMLVFASSRHFRLLDQLARERRENEDLDRALREDLEAALLRERDAREAAESAGRELGVELSRARYLAAIVESSDDAIIGKDLDGVVNSWNLAAETIFGYTAEEMLNRPIRQIIPFERMAEADTVLSKIRRGESIVNFETERRRKDGTLVPISLTVSPVRDERGRVVGASKIARDISDRKRAEADLADLQKRLLALVSASATLLKSPRANDVRAASLQIAHDLVEADAYAVWTLDSANKVWRISASQGVSDTFVRTAVVAGERARLQRFDQPLAICDLDANELVEQRRSAYQQEGLRSLLTLPLLIEGEVQASLVLYFRDRHDISDVELETARALANLVSAALTTAELYDRQRQSRLRFECLAAVGEILEKSLDWHDTLRQVLDLTVPFVSDWGAIDLVEDGRETRRLLDTEHSRPHRGDWQLVRKSLADPASPLNIQKVIETARPVMYQCEEPQPPAAVEGHQSPVAPRMSSAIIVPLCVRGQPIGTITWANAESRPPYSDDDLGLCSSIANRAGLAIDRARAYEEARRANQLKDDFLATLSHELRTPLNAIVGYSTLLSTGTLDRPGEERAFATLSRNASALSQIVEDVLDVSRIVSGKVSLQTEAVDLGTIISHAEAIVRPAADAKGVELDTQIEPGIPLIAGDPDRLQQVVWNLLSNAVKFTAGGGAVRIRLSHTNDVVRIAISDTGCGIAPEFLPYVFERFRQASSGFSRTHGGLGLGLAICRDLVELHGGIITAASAGLGQGATFSVDLPALAPVDRFASSLASTPGDAQTARDVSSIQSPLSGIRVLVVDDEVDALMLLQDVLEAAGAAVTCARSTDEACRSIDATPPDVLIADLGMPEADGFELIRRIRNGQASHRDIPAAALTAYARSEDRARTLGEGFQVHLSKPIDPGGLVAAVASLVQKPPSFEPGRAQA